ncbi:MAG: signal peptidase II, partial [Firmicutes bacterium]|nr:signal peptidase II [Bacillota bacterium]
NLICRVLHGYVIDFIDIHFIPVFNVADIAITIGCVLFCLCVLLPKKK